MCLRKRKIKNPVKEKNRLSISKLDIDIPCGRCVQCTKKRQNDWLVRSYFEYISKPTDGFFVTLDFSELCVPLFNVKTGVAATPEDRSRYLLFCDDYQNQCQDIIPCFDGLLMTRFFEKLRDQRIPPFRYLCVSDFGDFMERPHYHLVFLFDKGAIDEETFFDVLGHCWIYGSRTNIQKITSRYKNPFKAFEYVCKYTVKDDKFDQLRRQYSLPRRFSARAVSSVGYGAQALDPREFPSERLIKEGVIFMENPVLTKKYMKENSLVYIDCKNDGTLTPFAIPRFYELKLMRNWRWNSTEKKEESWLNADGIELARLRHNTDYVRYYQSFLDSKLILDVSDVNLQSTFEHYYPASPYRGMLWKDIVDDVSLDLDSFWEFCRIRSFLKYHTEVPHGAGRYRPVKYYTNQGSPAYSKVGFGYGYYWGASQSEDIWNKFDFFEDDIDRYIEATFLFDLYNMNQNFKRADYEDYLRIEQNHERCRQKIATDPSLFWHLRRHNFNFKSLNPKAYESKTG